MISVQYPHFAAHPFYVMADPAISQAMPNLQKMASQDTFSSGSETRAKQSTPGAKRRPSRAGTRSVSTLTAAQLERKRANDREAQRAIRQRTKDHIENLERRITELSATNDTSAKLMHALQRNEELEQENALLRSRLNHAVAAMSESGLNSDNIMLPAGPASPNRRMKITTQIRTSTTPTPRSVPTPSVQGPMPPQEAWNSAYSPVSSAIDRSPSVADVSPVAANMRWGTHHSQVSPAIPEPERNMHAVDPNIQQPVGYSYVLDSNGRPIQQVQQVQQVQYQPEAQMIPAYPQTTSPPAHVTDYHSRHSGAPMAPAPASTYAAYPGGQGYMPASPHESEPMQMMHRSSMDSQQQLMYNMQPNMKSEH